MKVKVTQNNLNQALSAVARVADSKGTLPVLANILIKVTENSLMVSATNLDIGITKFVGAKIDQPGSITVPAGLITSFVSSLPSSVINLDLDEKKLKITTDQYDCVINGIAAEEFPVIPHIEKGKTININAKNFKRALQQVLFAVSTNESRPVLTGVMLYSDNKKLYMVATDSSRLSESYVSDTTEQVKILVPATAMNDLLRVIDDSVETITITEDSQQALFKFNETELISRLLESNYPDYKNLIPKNFEHKAKLKRADLLNIVKVSSLFAKETAGSITVELDETDKLVRIKSLASQVGENSATAKGTIDGSGSITLNSKFLIEAINSFDCEDIEFNFNSKIEPVLLKDPKDNNYLHIIMPLKA